MPKRSLPVIYKRVRFQVTGSVFAFSVRHGFIIFNFENFQNLIAYSQSATVKTSCISLKFQKNLYARKNVKVKVTAKTQQITKFTILLFPVACQIA